MNTDPGPNAVYCIWTWPKAATSTAKR